MTASNNTRNIERGQSSTTQLTYGFGFNSKREHKTYVNNKVTKVYKVWINMLQRSYCKKYHEKQPTYIGCSVADDWRDFQDFADWFYSHPYSDIGYDLDKDLLFPSKKIYSPDTCCFVPKDLNNLLIDSGATRGNLPQGVSCDKNKYRARLWVNGKQINLGSFDNIEDAHNAYKVAKESHVKEKALKWKGGIARDVFTTLMRWTLDD